MHEDWSVGDRFNAIMYEARRITLASPEFVLLYLVPLVIFGVFVDTRSSTGYDLVLSIAGLVLGFAMTKGMLEKSGLTPQGLASGFGTFFGISLLSNLAIILGLVLLVIPGLVLIVRWSPIYGFGLAEQGGVSDAMSASWAATEKHMGPIAIALIVPTALFLFGFSFYFWASDEEAVMTLGPAIFANLGVYGGAAASNIIGLAVYSRVSSRNQADVAEIFS